MELYSVSVFYNGDDTYMPMENSTKFTVSKVSDYNMTVDIADIIKGEKMLQLLLLFLKTEPVV